MEKSMILIITLVSMLLINGCKNTNNIDNSLNSTNRPASVIEAEDHYIPWWQK